MNKLMGDGKARHKRDFGRQKAVNHSRYFFLILAAFCLGIISLTAVPAAWTANPKAMVEGNKKPAPHHKRNRSETRRVIKDLLQKAKRDLSMNNQASAARYLYQIYLNFPDNPAAESALWRSAELRKKLASHHPGADLERVKDMFRDFINSYPSSKRVPAAYLELGISYFHMGFYREALSYFKLFEESYPASPLLFKAMMWHREALMKTGRQAEAARLFYRLTHSADQHLRLIGQVGMGELRYKQGRYQEAKNYFQMVMIKHPDYYRRDPALLRPAGLTNLKSGNIKLGRRQLYHYLSLDYEVDDRPALLAALAESYHKHGDYKAAASLYREIIHESGGRRHSALLAALRLAQYRDNSHFKMSKNEAVYLADPDGDAPYIAVLDKYPAEAMAQDARYALFRRYKSRHELNRAYDVGRSFLRAQRGIKGRRRQIGNILLYLTAEFLKKKDYQKIYDLYFVDFRHIKDFPDGRLLYMVGRAMEALNLDKQAAVVYYRALKWQLPEKDKIDLYYRRAAVYLRLKDYASADRLLTYIRKLYKGKRAVGEIDYYSAELAEIRNHKDRALDFYEQAVDNPTFADKMAIYAGNAIRLALELGKNERAALIWHKAASRNIAPLQGQALGLKVADALRQTGDFKTAADLYKAVLSPPYPKKGENAQLCALYLGDVLLKLRQDTEAVDYYKKAQAGDNKMVKELAAERLRQKSLNAKVRSIKFSK